MEHLDFKNTECYRTRYSTISQLKKDNLPVLIYGSGRFAIAVAEMCIRYEIKILAFLVPNEYWLDGTDEKQVIGYKIPCYKEITASLIKEPYNVLLGMIDCSLINHVKEKFSYCRHVEWLSAYEPHIMSWEYLENNNEVFHELYESLNDAESKAVLEAYLHARYTGDMKCLSSLMHSEKYLYDWELLNISESDVIIDGGAFRGDSISEIKEYLGKLPEAFFAFEPDEDNMENLLKAFRFEINGKIHPISTGLYSSDKIMRFNNSGTLGSAISEMGSTEIKVQAIDMHSEYRDVTVIKMDIEGSELEALKGAYNLIADKRPRLAICIYHRNEDLLEIYNYLKQFDYSFYLRHHSRYEEETVLYAI